MSQVHLKHKKAPAIGIDLGTSYSCVGVFQNGKVQIIPNEQGNNITPSYVAFTKTGRLVGNAAKNQLSRNPSNTVFDSKRLIGRKFDDPLVAFDKKHWPFDIVGVERGRPKVKVDYRGKTKTLTAEELSSMILAKMKQTAEAYLGQRVTDAVISLPAHFNNAQRRSVEDAAIIAGLSVLHIIVAPVAASMAFGMEKQIRCETNVLVFDLGGGTVDVSIMTIADGIFEVRSISGDIHLGGADFDNRMVNHFIQEFKIKFKKDISGSKRALCRLRAACQNAKHQLSTVSEATIEIDSLFEGIDFYTKITRAQFEEMNMDLFQGTLEPIEKALRDARFHKSQIHHVVLVGGSSRIPKVQKLLQDFFGGKELSKSINPDEAIVYGATLQAAILSGEPSEKIMDLLLVSVTPMSLGIETAGGIMTTLIKRNSTIPKKETQVFTTSGVPGELVLCGYNHNVMESIINNTDPNMESQSPKISAQPQNKVCTNENAESELSYIVVKIYEGESTKTKDNNLLGSFELTGIPAAPGELWIDVTFSIYRNGSLDVSATDSATGKETKLTVTNDEGRLTTYEIEQMVKEAEEYKADEEREFLLSQAKNNLEIFVHHTKNEMEELRSMIEDTITKCHKVIDWIDTTETADIEDYDEKQKVLKEMCAQAFKKLYDSSIAGASDVHS